MKVINLLPKPIIKVEFSLSKVKFLPEFFGCYIITTSYGDILYIGQTKNIKSRIRQHLNDPSKTAKTPLGFGHYLYYSVVANESDLLKLERGWMHHFELSEGKLPILNSVHSPIK